MYGLGTFVKNQMTVAVWVYPWGGCYFIFYYIGLHVWFCAINMLFFALMAL